MYSHTGVALYLKAGRVLCLISVYTFTCKHSCFFWLSPQLPSKCRCMALSIFLREVWLSWQVPVFAYVLLCWFFGWCCFFPIFLCSLVFVLFWFCFFLMQFQAFNFMWTFRDFCISGHSMYCISDCLSVLAAWHILKATKRHLSKSKLLKA